MKAAEIVVTKGKCGARGNKKIKRHVHFKYAILCSKFVRSYAPSDFKDTLAPPNLAFID